MQLPLSDHGSRQIMTFGHLLHEVAETNLLRALAARISCSIDIGANVGWYTRILAGSGGRVLAFEPNPRIYPYLSANTEEFESAETLPIAVGDVDGMTTLYSAVSSDLSSTTRRVGTPVEVKTTALDTVVTTDRIAPDLIKCDVEGGEIQVLRGARRLRSGVDPPVWLIEVDERFLAEQGITYEILEQEINGTGKAIRKFWVDANGSWAPLNR